MSAEIKKKIIIELDGHLAECPSYWVNFISFYVNEILDAESEDNLDSGGITVDAINERLERYNALFEEEGDLMVSKEVDF
jgi:hypothetical protein